MGHTSKKKTNGTPIPNDNEEYIALGVIKLFLKLVLAHKQAEEKIKILEKKLMKKESAQEKKVHKVMHEYGKGQLHSGSKKGPVVTSRKQAVAIGLSEARKQTAAHKPKKKK